MFLGESTKANEKPEFFSACEHLSFLLASPPAKSKLEIYDLQRLFSSSWLPLFTSHYLIQHLSFTVKVMNTFHFPVLKPWFYIKT